MARMDEIRSLEELAAEAARLLNGLSPKDSGATLITLSGELGAGKTAFTKAIAASLGVAGDITSPTFVLEKVYELPTETGRGFKRLIHIDAYRLKNGSELAALGFDELMSDALNLIVLEWPEKVAGALPKADIAFTFTVNNDGSRKIAYA